MHRQHFPWRGLCRTIFFLDGAVCSFVLPQIISWSPSRPIKKKQESYLGCLLFRPLGNGAMPLVGATDNHCP